MARYIGLLDGEAGAYGVSIPDAPGCVAMGETMDKAVQNAVAALAEWSSDVIADGGKLDAPRSIDELRRDPEVLEALSEGAGFVVIPLVLNSGKPARVNISMDTGLLEAIDESAERFGLTRSAFLATAARDKIGSSY